jgi:hypothetical protein
LSHFSYIYASIFLGVKNYVYPKILNSRFAVSYSNGLRRHSVIIIGEEKEKIKRVESFFGGRVIVAHSDRDYKHKESIPSQYSQLSSSDVPWASLALL